MDGESATGRSDPFYDVIEEAIDSIPDDLRGALSNVEFLVVRIPAP